MFEKKSAENNKRRYCPIAKLHGQVIQGVCSQDACEWWIDEGACCAIALIALSTIDVDEADEISVG